MLSERPLDREDAFHMIRSRTAEAGFKIKLGCHVFRATGITAYLEAGGTLENAQAMAAHERARAPRSFTTAPAMRSRSTRSSGSRFSRPLPFAIGREKHWRGLDEFCTYLLQQKMATNMEIVSLCTPARKSRLSLD
jgi:hypothetical protein